MLPGRRRNSRGLSRLRRRQARKCDTASEKAQEAATDEAGDPAQEPRRKNSRLLQARRDTADSFRAPGRHKEVPRQAVGELGGGHWARAEPSG